VHLCAGELIGDGGQSEVRNDDVAALVHHDLLQLQVAMDDAAVVGGGQVPDTQQQRRQVLAIRPARLAIESY
jgi:hypothetical protein